MNTAFHHTILELTRFLFIKYVEKYDILNSELWFFLISVEI